MKHFFSMVLAAAFILTTAAIPALAGNEAWSVDITSISEGDTFSAGSDILLEVDATDCENVKNIDFYANGAKIPGTVVGNSGSITWYNPCEGSYEITTKITFIGGGDAVEGNEKVNISVLPDREKITLLWSGESDLQVGTKSKTTASDSYAVFGIKSAKYDVINNAEVKFECDVDVNWSRGAVLIYSPEDISGLTCAVKFNYLKEDGSAGTVCGNAGNITAVKKGINHFSTGAVSNTDKKFGKISLVFSGVPTGQKATVYILGIYGMKDSDSTPVAAAEIGNHATEVCNEIGTYRINFNYPIFPDETKTPAVVSVEGNKVEGVTYRYGFNYVDIKLPALAAGKEYKVNIPADTILGYYTFVPTVSTLRAKYVAATEFAFTTKDSACDAAKPVVKMSYPKEGLTYSDNISFAAQVIAPSSAISKVEFYSGDEKIGDGIKMTEGEWWCTPSNALAEKQHSVTAKFLNASNDVVAETATASYTVASPKYCVKGISDGDVIVAAEEKFRMVTVVDAAYENVVSDIATNVDKVEFYNENDVLLAADDSSPYEYKLVFDNYGAHLIKAKVYDSYGGVKTYINSYNVVNGIKNTNSYEQNFDNIGSEYDIKSDFFGGKVSGAGVSYAVEDGALKFKHNDSSGMKQFAFKYAGADAGAKVHYYEFDLMLSGLGYTCSLAGGWTKTEDTLIETGAGKDNLQINTPYKIGIVLDFNTSDANDKPTAIIRCNGKEMKRIVLTKFGTNGARDTILHNRLYTQNHTVTIDNVKYTVYDVDNTKAFGTGEYEREFDVSALGTNSLTVTASATNTTDNAVQLVNIIAVYDENKILLAAPTVDKITYNANDFKTQSYNIALPPDAATVCIFTWDGLDTLSPIGIWKTSK